MDQQKTAALCGMEESVCRLIELYCRLCPSVKEMTDWFSGIQFDVLRPEVSCMAAAMAAARDYNGAPLDLVPRLRGILRYVHTLNSGMTAGLCALGKQFNAAGIPAVLLGSTAVHLRYPNPPRRHMWQTEIGVSAADFPRVAALAEQAGFDVKQTPYSITARCGNTQCVLIRKGIEYVQGTTDLTVNGVLFLLPSSGELLADLAEAVFQVLTGPAPGAKLIPWIMDLHGVITSTADWKSAASAAAARGTVGRVRLVLELYHSLVPNTLTGEVLNLFGTGDHTARLAQLLLEYRDLKPGRFRLKRSWFSALLKSEGAPLAALGLLLKSLQQALGQKITLKN